MPAGHTPRVTFLFIFFFFEKGTYNKKYVDHELLYMNTKSYRNEINLKISLWCFLRISLILGQLKRMLDLKFLSHKKSSYGNVLQVLFLGFHRTYLSQKKNET